MEPPAGLAEELVLDELLDLTLYERLRPRAGPELSRVLDELIATERRHFAFWQDFFSLRRQTLDLPRRLKLALLLAACRVFGEPAARLTLEAIEVYGVRKYLQVWRRYRQTPLGAALRGILDDELQHEDDALAELAARRINPERVRSLFLGFNDGLVEILGALSGFFAAFRDPRTVSVASLTVAIAGAFSMAAGAYAAASSEHEMRETERGKNQFLGKSPAEGPPTSDRPLVAGILVGASYLFGALIPVLPALLGARSPLPSVALAGAMIVAVSGIVSFLSGMDARRRIAMNLVVIALAMSVSYALGAAARSLFGVSV